MQLSIFNHIWCPGGSSRAKKSLLKFALYLHCCMLRIGWWQRPAKKTKTNQNHRIHFSLVPPHTRNASQASPLQIMQGHPQKVCTRRLLGTMEMGPTVPDIHHGNVSLMLLCKVIKASTIRKCLCVAARLLMSADEIDQDPRKDNRNKSLRQFQKMQKDPEPLGTVHSCNAVQGLKKCEVCSPSLQTRPHASPLRC